MIEHHIIPTLRNKYMDNITLADIIQETVNFSVSMEEKSFR